MRLDFGQQTSLSQSVPSAVAGHSDRPRSTGWPAFTWRAAFVDEAVLAAVFKILSAWFLTIYTLRFAFVRDGLFLYAEDDFFYYLKIADQILAGHGITFDGAHATNGFHPLWLVVVLAVRAMAPTLADFQLLFSGFLAVLTLATFWAALRALERMARTPSPYANILIATVYVFLFEKYSHAMEIKALGLLYPLYLVARSRRRLWLEIATASLLVLTRLDFVLYFVVPALVALGKERRLGRSFRLAVAPACVLALYAIWSHVEFAMWTPVSSAIKQLKDGLIFNPTALPIGANGIDHLLVTMPFALNLLLLVWASWKRMFDRPFFAALAFCAVFYVLLATTSNWPIWMWYYYPIFLCILHYRQIVEAAREVRRPANILDRDDLSSNRRPDLGVCSGACADAKPGSSFSGHARAATASRAGFALATMSLWIACGLLAAKATALPPRAAILDEARFLASFEATHSGIYGIGDRAGIPSILMRSPIVQLEGLVMDRHMLELIGRRTPLCQILADYKVRYYVTRRPAATGEAADGASCRRVVEPQQATLRHPSAAVPVSQAMFCGGPLASFVSNTNAAPIETAVYAAAACR
jgi:hypothetical protein